MERVVHKFRSFADAAQSEKTYMLSLTSDERIEIARKIILSVHPNIEELPDVRAYHKHYGKPAFILKRY